MQKQGSPFQKPSALHKLWKDLNQLRAKANSAKLHSPCVRPGPCLQKPWQNRGTNLKPRRRLQSKHACCATATRLVRKRVARFCGLRSSRPCPKQNKLRESEKTNIKGNSTETHIAHNKPHNLWKRASELLEAAENYLANDCN